MRRRNSRIPWSLLWLGLFFLSLRPFGPAQRAVEVASAPLRVVAELASPLTLLDAKRVSAAERALADGTGNDAEENVRLLADLGRGALPTEARLLSKRRVVHAEVVGRTDADHLEIRMRDPRGVAPGMPVASGDAYVGRVQRLARAGEPADLAIVALVTGADFHVGAIVEEPERPGSGGSLEFLGRSVQDAVLLTVGGVVVEARKRGGRRRELKGLAVHYPSDRSIEGGLARVHELFDDAERFADLAEGLYLGEVQRDANEHWVVPELDFMDGLFQVVVLTPPDPELGSAIAFETVLFDSNWVRARALNVADPSPARRTRKVRVGQRHGVSSGAAVTSVGAHLVGRVLRAGVATSDVALLDDLGFSVVAVARIDGVEVPQVLGRLIALGRDPESGAFAFRWIVRVALDPEVRASGEHTRTARLYTGSGDEGLPAGFSFGETELPLDAAPGEERTLLVVPAVDPADVHTLFVRTTPAVRVEEAP